MRIDARPAVSRPRHRVPLLPDGMCGEGFDTMLSRKLVVNMSLHYLQLSPVNLLILMAILPLTVENIAFHAHLAKHIDREPPFYSGVGNGR
jgi:hypothetical protein